MQSSLRRQCEGTVVIQTIHIPDYDRLSPDARKTFGFKDLINSVLFYK